MLGRAGHACWKELLITEVRKCRSLQRFKAVAGRVLKRASDHGCSKSPLVADVRKYARHESSKEFLIRCLNRLLIVDVVSERPARYRCLKGRGCFQRCSKELHLIGV